MGKSLPWSRDTPHRESPRRESTVDRGELRSALHARGAVVVYHGPMVDTNIETEAKWRADEREHERLRAALRQAGATHIGTVREINSLFDSVDDALRLSGQVLRLRSLDDGDSILTFKGPATYHEGIKVREETELHLSDHDAMIGILRSLGFSTSLQYQKTRESWDFDGAVVALDTLEFGRFIEIEGAEGQIRHAADRGPRPAVQRRRPDRGLRADARMAGAGCAHVLRGRRCRTVRGPAGDRGGLSRAAPR